MLQGIVVLNGQVLYDNLEDIPEGLLAHASDKGVAASVHRYTIPEARVRQHDADLRAAGKPPIIGFVP